MAALGSLVVAGVWLRVVGLGHRQLAVDEYYWVSSIRHILQGGWPAFPDGGWYVRGVLAQYITAASVLIFGDALWVYRLPSVLFSVAIVVLSVVYARGYVSRASAVAVGVVLLFSTWQIEFAHFARMYVPFAAAGLAWLLLLRRRMSRTAGLGVPVLGGLLLGFHGLGLLLLPWAALPLLDRRRFRDRRAWASYAMLTALVWAGAVLFLRWNARTAGVVDPLPSGFVPASAPLIRWPSLPLVAESWVPLAWLSVLMATAAVGLLLRRRGAPTPAAAWLAVLAGASLAHLLLPVLAALVVLTVRFRLRSRWREWPGTGVVLIGSALAFLTWTGVVLLNPDWVGTVEAGSVAGAVRRLVAGWPDLYVPIVRPWSRTAPLLGVLLGAGVLGHGLLSLREPWPNVLLAPGVMVSLVIAAIGVLPSSYTSTRYVFFLAPVAFTAVAVVVERGVTRAFRDRSARRWAPATAILILFAVTEDQNLGYYGSVDSAAVRFRLPPFDRYGDLWYQRRDYRSPAVYVDTAAAPGARVIAAGVPVVSWYLDREHAVYLDRADRRFVDVARERGTRELWSGRRLLSTPAEVRTWLNGAAEAWVIRPVQAAHPLDLPVPGRTVAPVYRSVDGRIEVLRLGPPTHPPGR